MQAQSIRPCPPGNSSCWGRPARPPPATATTTATCCGGTPRACCSTPARARSASCCWPAWPRRPSPGSASPTSTATTASACPGSCSGCPSTTWPTRSTSGTRPSGQEFYDRLRRCALYNDTVDVRPHPVHDEGVVDPGPEPFALLAGRLDHRAETFGWRVVEPDGRRMLPDRLEEAGITGPRCRSPATGGFAGHGGRAGGDPGGDERAPPGPDLRLRHGHPPLRRRRRPGRRRRPAGLRVDVPGARRRPGRRLRAPDGRPRRPGWRAEAGARRLVLTHFSQRYPDDAAFAAEAGEIFPDVVVVRDLDRVPVPPRAG